MCQYDTLNVIRHRLRNYLLASFVLFMKSKVEECQEIYRLTNRPVLFNPILAEKIRHKDSTILTRM